MIDMIKRNKFAIILILLFNLTIAGILVSKGVWVSKIDGVEVSKDAFMDYYTGFIDFQVMGSPVPVSRDKLKKLKQNKEQLGFFLQSFEDEYLILRKAKEKKVYNKKDIDRKVNLISKVIKNKLIVKAFLDKFIYPKVKVSNKEVNKAYKEEMAKDNNSYKGLSKKNIRSIIRERIRAKKALEKLKLYTAKLRLESEVIRNKSALK